KEFAVSATDFLPLIDVDDIHPGAHDVRKLAAEAFDGALDVAQGLARLSIGIAHANDAAVGAGGGRSRDEDAIADANGARVSDDRLPRRTGGKGFAPHGAARSDDARELNRIDHN